MIWCVEDDESVREIEIYTLQSTGFEARGFADSESFLQALEKEKPELILLDIMLPGEDGMELLKRIRMSSETYRIPVILATAKGSEYDKVRGLDMGADDYLVKPFGMMEMVSHIKAVLRRCSPAAAEHLLRAGGLVVNPDNRTAEADGVRLALTYKEFEMLRLFLKNPGMAFTREQLFTTIWGEEFVGESRTVDMHIRTLRQKLGKYGEMIETVRNVGYRMEVPEQ